MSITAPIPGPPPQVAAEVYSRAAALCDVIVGNDVEFGFMAGDPAQGLAKARSLITQGAQIVIYKMGEKGAITITPDGEFATGIYPTAALKPTGAGDSFLGRLHRGSGHRPPPARRRPARLCRRRDGRGPRRLRPGHAQHSRT